MRQTTPSSAHSKAHAFRERPKSRDAQTPPPPKQIPPSSEPHAPDCAPRMPESAPSADSRTCQTPRTAPNLYSPAQQSHQSSDAPADFRAAASRPSPRSPSQPAFSRAQQSAADESAPQIISPLPLRPP